MFETNLRGYLPVKLNERIKYTLCGQPGLSGQLLVTKAEREGWFKVQITGEGNKSTHYISEGGSITIGRETKDNQGVVDVRNLFPGLRGEFYREVSRNHLTMGVTRSGQPYLLDSGKVATLIENYGFLRGIFQGSVTSRDQFDVNLGSSHISLNLKPLKSDLLMTVPNGAQRLEGRELLIGTGSKCDLVVNRTNFPGCDRSIAFVSALHLSILFNSETSMVTIRDFSTRGTFIDQR